MADILKIAVAQVPSEKGDVTTNTETHLTAIKKAAEIGITYIAFPELSLTGYEPQLAIDLAFSKTDPRLAPLIEAAIRYQIYIVTGAPLQTNGLPHICEFIITPKGKVETYSKMNLHPGEERYFSTGDSYYSVKIGRHKIFNAICADTNNAAHAEICAEMGATIYMAGMLIGASGYEPDTNTLSGYSKKHGFLVAMANHNKPTGGWAPIGKSGIWESSRLIAVAGETQNALVVATESPHGWNGEVVEI